MGNIGSGTGSTFPVTLDTQTVPEQNGITVARAAVPNDLASAILAIENDLGTRNALLGGFVDARQYSSINAAVSDGANKTVLVSGSMNLAASLTVPANVGMWILNGGMLVSGGFTATIQGPFIAGPYHVFSGFAIGNITLGAGASVGAYPEWWGAAGDGTTDDITSYLSAFSALRNGGTLKISPKDYRITDELAIPSGLIIAGSGNVDRWYGIPTGNERPSFIFQDTVGKAVFTVGNNIRDWQIRDLSLGASLTNQYSLGHGVTGKYGIKFGGYYPDSSYRYSLSRVTFYDFDDAINVQSLSGIIPGWEVDNTILSQCTFFNNNRGAYLGSRNNDYWHFDTCSFFMPANGDGIYLEHSGFIEVENCIGGGLVNNNNDFIHVAADYDITKIIGCQAENCANFLHVDNSAGYDNTYFPIILDGCIVEAPVNLDRQVHLISHGSRFTQLVNVKGDNSLIDTYSDSYVDGSSVFHPGSEAYNITGAHCVFNIAPIIYRSGAGSPLNVVTPRFTGEEYYDSTNVIWYKSSLNSGSYWTRIDSISRTGSSPITSNGKSGTEGTTIYDDNYFYLCAHTGTTGTLSVGTGAISIGSVNLTLSSGTIAAGSYITIVGVTGIKLVVASAGVNVSIDAPSDATVTTAALAYSVPSWKRVALSTF